MRLGFINRIRRILFDESFEFTRNCVQKLLDYLPKTTEIHWKEKKKTKYVNCRTGRENELSLADIDSFHGNKNMNGNSFNPSIVHSTLRIHTLFIKL